MDEIRRKLTLIEAQLRGRSLSIQLLGTAPLFFPAMGLMVGIGLQSILTTHPAATGCSVWLGLWIVLLGGWVAGVVVYLAMARRDPRPLILAIGALLCFVCLGALRLIAFERTAPNDIRNLVGHERTLATLRGRLLTPPRQPHHDWYFARLTFSDPTTAFYLKTRQIQTTDGWQETRGTIYIRVNEPTLDLRLGDVVEIDCWLYRLEAPTNPGQFDMAAYLKRRNVHLGASVPARDAIKVQANIARSPLSRLRHRLSQAASYALRGDGSPDNPREGLLEALLLGNRDHIDRQTYEAFRKTGLLHMISLSGLHLGIFAALVWRLGKAAGLSKPGRALACTIAIALFLLVVPPRAPTIRAAIIIWAFCLAVLRRRYIHPLNSLSLAAIVLLLIRPTQLFEAGWQLSFACVAAILALTDRIETFLHDHTHRWLGSEGNTRGFAKRLIRRIDPGTKRLFAMGVAAWIGSAGILLYHFYIITPLTSFWTVLVFPLVAFLLTVGFAKILLFFLLPTVSYFLGCPIEAAAGVLIGFVKILALPDINCLLIGRVGLSIISLYYGLVLWARFGRTRHVLWNRRLCVLTGLILLTYLGGLKWQRTHRDHLIMTCLDVGHGQAILVQLPGTRNVLFDAGSMYYHDVGSRIVLPFLDTIGIDRLHAIVISHGDIDHINGIPEIVDRRRVDRVYANAAFLDQAGMPGPEGLLLEYLADRGYIIEPVPDTVSTRAAKIETLRPFDAVTDPNTLNDNDRSIVSRITFTGMTILLCSDIEQNAQRGLLEHYPNLTAQIVVVPHHGSTATSEEAFLPHLQPRILIASCGRQHGDRSRPIRTAGLAKFFSTKQNGAITVCVGGPNMIETRPFVYGP